jgi:hypothetical protein
MRLILRYINVFVVCNVQMIVAVDNSFLSLLEMKVAPPLFPIALVSVCFGRGVMGFVFLFRDLSTKFLLHSTHGFLAFASSSDVGFLLFSFEYDVESSVLLSLWRF